MTDRLDPQMFLDPPGTYRPIPFWFWNGDLDEDELDRQLREMRDKGVLEAFIHARRGLEVPYLSETWFDRVGFTIRKAREYGMRMWLYDEDNWPSGYAGGRVLKARPECRAKNLAKITVPASEAHEIPQGKLVAVIARLGDQVADITDGVRDGSFEWVAQHKHWEISFFMERPGHWQPAYTDDWYVDLLDPKCVRQFIRSTHEVYWRRFKDDFGGAIAGIFTDEPGFYNNFWDRDPGTNTWTPDFLEEFERQKGYDLRPNLLSLWDDVGDYRRVRADYYDVYSALFRDVYFRALYDWCEEHGVVSIGHVTVEEELKLNARMFGDFFRAGEYEHVPGVDEIGQLRKDPNEYTPKLGSSAAHVFGRERCMSETFGVYGWKLTLEEMKKITDLQYARGINFFVPHAFYYSIEGDRKEECPPSEFWQNTWWRYFKRYADYVGRMSYMNTRGRHVADIAVYYPLSSVWAEITPTDASRPDEIDARFKEVSTLLLANQLDFDYLHDDSICAAMVQDGRLLIQDEEYGIFIIPAAMVMSVDTMNKLAEFVRGGGALIICGDLPKQAVLSGTDEELAGILASLRDDSGKGRLIVLPSTDGVVQAVNSFHEPDLVLDPSVETINYLHRRVGDTDIYFLANRSPESHTFTGVFRATGVPVFWNAEDGTSANVLVYAQSDGRTRIPMKIEGFGSAYVVFSPGSDRPHVVRTDLPGITEVTVDSVTGLTPYTGTFYADVDIWGDVRRRTGDALDIPAGIELTDGWSFRLERETAWGKTDLGSWTEQGLEDYSGSAVYAIEFDLDADYLDRPLILDLGDVRETAEIWVNGSQVAVRTWRPYTADIRSAVREGANRLEVVVTNTLANRFTPEKLPSGLLGPVTITPMAEMVLR